ncbi:amino acid adenylation domain-containing protein [Krasilnikovia sp. MM14-A1259]|uniref:amino acid adenylation domain-containing protein n=1 Tax=Krasilnikovia sp. MM14-A1259 TaxID=3373539 RepID=UPI003817DE13
MRPTLIDEHFLEQVRHRPDAIALVHGNTRLTYRELHERAVAVAVGLRRLGVGRETLVGMAFEHGTDAVVTVLGIILAGGAYVPINPAFPPQRIAQLVRHSGVRVLVCSASAQPVIAAHATPGLTVVRVDELPAQGETAAVDFAPPPATGDRSPLAYVLYTSGSTGAAKGVMVEHAGVVRLVKDTDYLTFGPDVRFLQLGALEFDASTLEIWGPLLNGGRLCVIDKETAVVPWRVGAALREHGITTIGPTTPLFHQIVEEDPTIFAPLTELLVAGDVLSPRHVALVRAANPALRIVNGYGPTENTTLTTAYDVTTVDDQPIPIGRAIRGSTVLVLGPDDRAVPAGVSGELCTGGAGVARGYLHNADLTAARFPVIDGVRYYRTGDIVHADAAGDLHFHGRIDDQVKIRGKRIDLPDVNAALRAVDGVLDSYVRVHGDSTLNRRLLGYAVTTGLDEAAVQAALRETLPSYLCPDRIVVLPKLPLNTNGKVDVPRLPVPDAVSGRGPATHSPQEHRLAELWAEVLDVPADRIAADDSFLDLGGNSLRLGTLLGRIARRFGVQMSFGAAMAAPSLADMAKQVTAADTAAWSTPAPVPAGVASDLHPQQLGLYALWQADPASLAYNLPARMELRGPLEADRLRATLDALVQRHPALRTRFLLDGDTVRQIPVDGVTVPFAYLAEPDPAAVAAFVRPFPLDEAPLLRALLVCHGPGHHELHIDVHHIVFDGVSLRVLLTELLAAYAGTELAPVTCDYPALAQWHHDRLADSSTAETEAYWLRELADPPAALELPTDRPRGRRRPTAAATVTRTLGTGHLTLVERAADRHAVTPFPVLLAAFHATLSRLTGQRDIIVGTPVSGRVHPESETTVGMFVSTVCLRSVVDDSTTLADLTRQLAERHRAALTHQDFPFERLVRRLGVAAQPGRHPVFEALFAWQNIDFAELGTGELTAAVRIDPAPASRFDLNLQAYQHPDRLVLELQFAAELFDHASAAYLLDQYVDSLTELTTEPATAVFTRDVAPVAAVELADFDF